MKQEEQLVSLLEQEQHLSQSDAAVGLLVRRWKV